MMTVKSLIQRVFLLSLICLMPGCSRNSRAQEETKITVRYKASRLFPGDCGSFWIYKGLEGRKLRISVLLGEEDLPPFLDLVKKNSDSLNPPSLREALGNLKLSPGVPLFLCQWDVSSSDTPTLTPDTPCSYSDQPMVVRLSSSPDDLLITKLTVEDIQNLRSAGVKGIVDVYEQRIAPPVGPIARKDLEQVVGAADLAGLQVTGLSIYRGDACDYAFADGIGLVGVFLGRRWNTRGEAQNHQVKIMKGQPLVEVLAFCEVKDKNGKVVVRFPPAESSSNEKDGNR